jgi:Ribbon-helix-helix protein, copG family
VLEEYKYRLAEMQEGCCEPSLILAITITDRIFSAGIMAKEDIAKRKGPGRPAKGKVKMTFKLEPRVVGALEKAKDMTGRGKSELVEAAVIAYLHLSSEEGSSSSR